MADAREASLTGDWDAVASLLECVSTTSREQRVEVAFLTARATLQAGLPDRALRALDDIDTLLAEAEQPQATLLRGMTLVALDRNDEGTALLGRIAESAVGPQQAEAVFELAKAYRQAERLDDAEVMLARLVDVELVERTEHVVASAMKLYGEIELARRRRPVAARHFLDALDVLRAAPQAGAPLRATLLHALASIAVETLDLRLIARVRRELVTIAWPRGSEAVRAWVDQARVAGELLSGDEVGAWASAFMNLRTAPAGGRYVVALLDAAQVSRAAGERFVPDRLVLTAADVARFVDWNGADRRVLLRAIREVAPMDVVAADELSALYANMPSSPGDEATAWKLMTRAAVAGANDHLVDQEAHLRAARAMFREAGDLYGELIALVSLLEVAPDDELLSRADELSQFVPLSWLRRAYESLAQRFNGPAKLSPAERRVMLAIASGQSTAEIAAAFGRSKNTIRNQTRRVFAVMGVRTRTGLVTKCAAMGLIPTASK